VIGLLPLGEKGKIIIDLRDKSAMMARSFGRVFTGKEYLF